MEASLLEAIQESFSEDRMQVLPISEFMDFDLSSKRAGIMLAFLPFSLSECLYFPNGLTKSEYEKLELLFEDASCLDYFYSLQTDYYNFYCKDATLRFWTDPLPSFPGFYLADVFENPDKLIDAVKEYSFNDSRVKFLVQYPFEVCYFVTILSIMSAVFGVSSFVALYSTIRLGILDYLPFGILAFLAVACIGGAVAIWYKFQSGIDKDSWYLARGKKLIHMLRSKLAIYFQDLDWKN